MKPERDRSTDPGFSSRKLNEILASLRTLERRESDQLAALNRVEQILLKASKGPDGAKQPEQPTSRGPMNSRLQRLATLVTLVASIATVVGLVYAGLTLQASTDAAQRASINQSYAVSTRQCSTYDVAGHTVIEGVEVFTVLTNTGRLPITLLGLYSPKDVGQADLSFKGEFLNPSREQFQNEPFVLDVGQAVAISVVYPATESEIQTGGRKVVQKFSTYVDVKLSDGEEIVPSSDNARAVAPALVRDALRSAAQLKCNAQMVEHDYPGNPPIFPKETPTPEPHPTLFPLPTP